jgi:RNA polymerase sigma-70 factor (ECF subfamily)
VPTAPNAPHDEALKQLWERGRAAWPHLALEENAFAAHLRTRNDAGPLDRIHAEDLYLACACTIGLEGAAQALRTLHQPTLERRLRTLEPRREVAAEIVHTLFVRLLVAEGNAAPRISEYSGRGPLSAWLRMAASRSAMNARRDETRRKAILAEQAPDPVGLVEPELAFVKGRYANDFAAALKEALSGLPRDERALLRLHYVDGLTMDAIARAKGWSRAGAHRRVAAARANALSAMRARLEERLGLSGLELTSLMNDVRSRIHLTLPGVLGDE